jgi:hypothetical protein
MEFLWCGYGDSLLGLVLLKLPRMISSPVPLKSFIMAEVTYESWQWRVSAGWLSGHACYCKRFQGFYTVFNGCVIVGHSLDREWICRITVWSHRSVGFGKQRGCYDVMMFYDVMGLCFCAIVRVNCVCWLVCVGPYLDNEWSILRAVFVWGTGNSW